MVPTRLIPSFSSFSPGRGRGDQPSARTRHLQRLSPALSGHGPAPVLTPLCLLAPPTPLPAEPQPHLVLTKTPSSPKPSGLRGRASPALLSAESSLFLSGLSSPSCSGNGDGPQGSARTVLSPSEPGTPWGARLSVDYSDSDFHAVPLAGQQAGSTAPWRPRGRAGTAAPAQNGSLPSGLLVLLVRLSFLVTQTQTNASLTFPPAPSSQSPRPSFLSDISGLCPLLSMFWPCHR